jgi:hypothetical protein
LNKLNLTLLVKIQKIQLAIILTKKLMDSLVVR